MRLGATLKSRTSGALAVLLLCVLSWASVCDLSCQLPDFAGHGCCASKSPSAAAVVAQSSECHGMAAMTPQAANAAIHAPLHAGTMPCEQNVSAASVDGNDHSFDSAGLIATAAKVVAGNLHLPIATLHRETPPLRASGFHPLFVSLRV